MDYFTQPMDLLQFSGILYRKFLPIFIHYSHVLIKLITSHRMPLVILYITSCNMQHTFQEWMKSNCATKRLVHILRLRRAQFQISALRSGILTNNFRGFSSVIYKFRAYSLHEATTTFLHNSLKSLLADHPIPPSYIIWNIKNVLKWNKNE